jgi:hypothetical protein
MALRMRVLAKRPADEDTEVQLLTPENDLSDCSIASLRHEQSKFWDAEVLRSRQWT